jgi:glycosyltransferase involved in cell wall biosynthesis
MGLIFFPRGGSAHVAGNLARALPAAGWDVRLVSGSVRIPGRPGEARAFYRGLDVTPVDMTAALAAPDPMLATPPLHPSYEDRPAAPDRVFCALDDAAYEHQVDAWARALEAAGAADAAVLHLHHLTPLNAAARLVAPGVPVVGHLHGTELLMLEEAEADPGRWPHTGAWLRRMRSWACSDERLIVLSDSQVARAERLLGIDPDRCVRIANGFDPAVFRPRQVDHVAFWRRHLVDAPQGWAPGEEAGSVRYGEEDLAAFARGDPVLLYVGRFTAVKRLPLLIEAYARARPAFERRAPLVLLGGFPGEWEGEHPLQTIRRTGARDVFLAGWHGHDELPAFLAATDAVVLPSVREQFGQVLVEGMACGLPVVAVNVHGPAEIVDDGRTGWLVGPDDAEALAAALVDVVNHPAERRRRGVAAREDARARFAWPALAARLAGVYDEVLAAGAARPR